MGPRDVVVIGGGIVGLASALRLEQQFPDARVRVLEKEAAVCRHQSGHNSGVLHCGLYYKPGSLKARLAVNGIRQMVAFCVENRIPHEICGKLVVAASEEELPRLHALEERGRQNGLEGLRFLTREQFLEIEPHAGGVAALHVPQEGIVDYHRVAEAMVKKIRRGGGEVMLQARATSLRATPRGWLVLTTAGDWEADLLVNCAGLHSDRVSALDGHRREIRIVPFRGEYYRLRPQSEGLVRNLIYPVPDPKFPFLGVHFTRLIHGGVEAGPNAVLAFAREGYRKRDVNVRDLFDSLSYTGLWRFLAHYPRMCWAELERSFSRRLFCRSLQKLVPEIRVEDLGRGGAGVRAQALSPTGELMQDFHFVVRRRALHVANAPSPGATASLAIGEEIARTAARVLEG